jgi:hypothetical protein
LNTRANRIALYIAVFFAIVSWRYGARVAGIVIGGGFIGYLIEFHLFRALIRFGGRRRPKGVEILLGTLGAIGGAAFVYYGLSVFLLGFIAMWFIVDAVALRFA